MSHSKIEICNIALGLLGAAPIRDFDEANKRSRLCDTFFDSSRDYLLSVHDWHFARAFKRLQELTLDPNTIPYGTYGYALPNDCLTPRSLYPKGSRENWELMGNILFARQQEEIGLYYTKKETATTLFSEDFVNLLSLALATRLAPAISQDPKLTQNLFTQYKAEMKEAWENSANVGTDYRGYDEDPLNDTFVNPEIGIQKYIPRIIT